MAAKKKQPAKNAQSKQKASAVPNYPRHPLSKALRIPRAISEQNAGKPCSEAEAAAFAGVGLSGPTRVEISSATKYGLLARRDGSLTLTDLARKILRPATDASALDGMREAVQQAPVISEVYSHYRGENLPARQFLVNVLQDKYGIPADKVNEFIEIFIDTLRSAELLDESGDKQRVLDTTSGGDGSAGNSQAIAKLGRKVTIESGATCFVLMPFGPPIGNHYSLIFERAIEKAGLRAVRADADIFGTGKIIDQIWDGISNAKVLVAELTNRNANVFYELGLAHALDKPVVLVSASEDDVPFDLRHIRVIYYDTTDPFWGQKLIEKVAENILSALSNPEEALFKKRVLSNA